MQIGRHIIHNPFILAPMAGITDLPFRKICRKMGAGLAVAEMISSLSKLRDTQKTQDRTNLKDESGIVSIQIVGNEPEMMAETAQFGFNQGADIIDINMGCPAKKVCKKEAGSALLKDELLVARILATVVKAVDIPVTLKIRTGWDRANKNALIIAKIAENEGIQALTIHGRTRADAFRGEAEYDTIAEVKAQSRIPVIANGDIKTLEQAQKVFSYTKADAVMIGRGAFGNPWIFKSLIDNEVYQPAYEEILSVLLEHINDLYLFYGEEKGLRIARKHLLWYLADLPIFTAQKRENLLQASTKQDQILMINKLFNFKLVGV